MRRNKFKEAAIIIGAATLATLTMEGVVYSLTPRIEDYVFCVPAGKSVDAYAMRGDLLYKEEGFGFGLHDDSRLSAIINEYFSSEIRGDPAFSSQGLPLGKPLSFQDADLVSRITYVQAKDYILRMDRRQPGYSSACTAVHK